MKNEKLKFVSELLAEGFISRMEFDRILSRKFKFSEILEELDMDGLPVIQIRPSFVRFLNVSTFFQ